MREEQKRILKLVEEGKLTAEEAILLIEKLSNTSTTDKEQEIKTELSTQVEQEQKKYYSSNENKQSSSVKHKFMDFVETAFAKIKDFDLDFNFGNAVEVKHIFQHTDTFINKIDLDVANGSVAIHPWDEKDVRIECDAKVYKIENQEEARQEFLKEVLFSIENGKLRFAVHKKQMKVHVKLYIPQEDYEHVKIRMFNGPITGEQLVAKDLRAKTANGAITLNKCTTTSMEIETANGHIKADETVSKDFEAETINGTIQIGGSFEKLDLQSFNGNITGVIQPENCHTAYIKTTTGAIDLTVSGQYDIDGELKSNLGSFKAELQNMSVIDEKNEVVQKSLRFKANEGNGKKLNLFAETKTGSITIKPL